MKTKIVDQSKNEGKIKLSKWKRTKKRKTKTRDIFVSQHSHGYNYK